MTTSTDAAQAAAAPPGQGQQLSPALPWGVVAEEEQQQDPVPAPADRLSLAAVGLDAGRRIEVRWIVQEGAEAAEEVKVGFQSTPLPPRAAVQDSRSHLTSSHLTSTRMDAL